MREPSSRGPRDVVRWEHVDFEARSGWLRKTKTGRVLVRLPLRVKAVLESLPRRPSGYVFPLTQNALHTAWEGVREKAGLQRLQFKDTSVRPNWSDASRAAAIV